MCRRIVVLTLAVSFVSTVGFAQSLRKPKLQKRWLRSKLHLFMPSDMQLGFEVPSFYEPLDEAIESFEKANRKKVRTTKLASSAYQAVIFDLLERKGGADIIVADHELIQELARRRLIMPLNRYLRFNPELWRSLPEKSRELFSYRHRLYALPLGEKEGFTTHGYAISRKDGRGTNGVFAFSLIKHLMAEVPLRGVQDLAVETLRVNWEKLGGDGSRTRRDEIVQDDGDLDTYYRVTAKATVKNIGEAESEQVKCKVDFGDGKYTQYVESDGLQVGESTDFVLEFDVPSDEFGDDGWQNLNWWVDPIEADANMANNFEATEFLTDVLAIPGPTLPDNSQFLIEADYIIGPRDTSPQVMFDGTNYFVIWAQRDQNFNFYNHNYHLKGALVTPSGIVASTFIINDEDAKYLSFNIAFDGTNFLVVWHERPSNDDYFQNPMNKIMGARVTTDGTVLDDPAIVIEDRVFFGWSIIASHVKPDVLYDGSNFLVVHQTVNRSGPAASGPAASWEDPAGIYARQVTPAGVVSPARVAIVEFDDDFAPMFGTGSMMQVTYRDGNALLVVEGRDASVNPNGYLPLDYYGIYAFWLDIDLVSGTPNPSLPEFVEGYVKGQSPSAESFQWPVVGVSNNDRFLLTWEDSSIQPLLHNTPGIAKAIGLPSQSGWGWVGSSSVLYQDAADTRPAIDFDGNMFTVVFKHFEGCHVYLATIPVKTNGVYGEPFVFYNSGNLVAELGFAFGNDSKGLIVYSNDASLQDFSLYGQFVDSSNN